MIPARKGRWFNAWFARQARARLQRTFGGMYVGGGTDALDGARAALAAGPVLVVSNHTSWWDPLVAIHLGHAVLRADGYALMDAKNLRRRGYFRRVGGFGVAMDRPDDGALAIRYAARLLNAPGRLVWIFPQGRERPVTERPLDFRPGGAEIARVARATVLPIALRYEFRGTERPDVLVHLGATLAPERDVSKARTDHVAAVTRGLDLLDAALRAGDLQGYPSVLRAPSDPLGTLAERALAWLAG